MPRANSSRKTSPRMKKLLLSRRRWYKKGVKAIWIVFTCFMLGLPTYIFCVNVNLFGFFGEMPSLRDIENPENDLSSELISADGISLGRYFRFNRSQVSYSQLSPELINTLLISEDHRFHEHSGLDFQAFVRVIYGVLTFDVSAKGGGSTVTQQLAKNLFTINPELDGSLAKLGAVPRRVIQKTKEWIIAIELEKNFTKEEIIAMYLNTCNFGSNAFGIKVASETYFKKRPAIVNIQESAVLVGLLQNPSLYNPRYNPNNALTKRNQVLYKLYSHGYFKSQQQYDSLVALPIRLNYSVQNQNAGIAPYFLNAIESDLERWCKEHGYNLLESGLKIYTTIDSRMQRHANAAVGESMKAQQQIFNEHWRGKNPWIDESGKEIEGFLDSRIKQTDIYRNLVSKYGEHSDSVMIKLKEKKRMRIFTWNGERDTVFNFFDSLSYYKRFLQAGFMAMNPETGAVKAWVGGISYKFFKYDQVRQGKRQPGSTFKPVVYGTAIEAGFNPCQKLQDISPTITLANRKTWTPPNALGDFGTGEWYTLRQALALSKNSITAQIMQRTGIENIISFARRIGITSHLDAVPTLSLGVSDLSVYELVGAYSTFVNLGTYTQPYFITKIEDRNGNVIQNFVPKIKQGISEQTAFTMVHMLMGGVQEEGGSSRSLSEEVTADNEVGGKTGTTNDASDGWYIGITHNLVAGAWVGGVERNIRYRQWSMGQGGRTALPIWDSFMRKVYADMNL
ncbi:MAG TPA: transglycosylase domain-containing protein [Chryseolinea sp.]|nr:transglycosylase domain-containing protein [Chryseolinea sp.]